MQNAVLSECERTPKPSKYKSKYFNTYRRGRVSRPANNFQKKACFARYFDLLRNAPRSSIYIHIGVALLVFGASLTSAVCQKILF